MLFLDKKFIKNDGGIEGVLYTYNCKNCNEEIVGQVIPVLCHKCGRQLEDVTLIDESLSARKTFHYDNDYYDDDSFYDTVYH